jgi:MFS superfamily sulfate permease-like transporter
VFTNWIPFRRQLEQLALVQGRDIVLDLSDVKLVDHTVMAKLHELKEMLADEGRVLELVGLDAHIPVSEHELAARRRGLVPVQRLVVITEPSAVSQLLDVVARFGASGYTLIPCQGAGRRGMREGRWQPEEQVRLEIIVPRELASELLSHLRRHVLPSLRATACVETVEAVFPEQFAPLPSPASRDGQAASSAMASTSH